MPSRKSTLVAVGVLEHKDKVCLIKFKRNVLAGNWGLPGGKIDVGESLQDAVVREYKEETGFNVKFEKLLAVLDEELTSEEGAEYFVMLVCRVSLLHDIELKRIENEEGTVDWFTKEEVLSGTLPMVRSDQETFKQVVLGNVRGYIFSQMTLENGTSTLSRFDVN
jgi:8-oxo-dGTP diphosphatase